MLTVAGRVVLFGDAVSQEPLLSIDTVVVNGGLPVPDVSVT